MASSDKKEGIKITLDDLAAVTLPDSTAPAAVPASPGDGSKSYGNISNAAEEAVGGSETRGSILLQAWFYLGVAGLLGAVIGWGICEPALVDGEGRRWGNFWLLPLVVTFLCLGLAIAESVVERSLRKALMRGLLALPLGVGFGFVFSFVANIIYTLALNMGFAAGMQSYRNPAWWIARAIAWMVFGVAGGIVYGIVGQSSKKAKFGILGGIIGAGLGGLVFDPISFVTGAGAPSRLVGLALFGMSTGIAMGLVESALKDRWFYVTAGPLAGKQFILYKSPTVIGSLQQSDIYLFKDQSILPQHAVLELSGARVQLRALGNVFVAGQPISSRVLQDGDMVQIGRYTFRYRERHRS